MRFTKYALIVLIFSFLACDASKKAIVQDSTVVKTTVANSEDIDRLFELMQGSFDSSAQADADSNYYNISLHMYPIWKEHGKYLYVEQALASMQSKPYRQRIYHLKQTEEGNISSAVYSVPADSLWIGKWKTPQAFSSINPTDLKEREGCAVILNYKGNNIYEGSTGDKTCQSSLRGASYAMSNVTVSPDKVVSWDQGFNEEGKQVWGAVNGGYTFDKLGTNLDWLVGSWKRDNDQPDQRTYEDWKKIDNQTYEGFGYTLSAKDTVFQENMTLHFDGNLWQCKVSGPGFEPVVFPFVHHGVGSFICRNDENDFPKAIKYWKDGSKLNASIYGGGDKINYNFSKR